MESKRILVTFASRSGTTAGVADVIGETLSANGMAVDIHPMQTVHNLTHYDAVIAGSAIRFDSWLPEAKQFINQHQTLLAQMPVATFLTCLALGISSDDQRESARQKAHQQWMRPIREQVSPVSEGLFAGALNLGKLPELHYRLIFRLPVMLGLFKEKDYRDWDAIQQWA